MSEEISFYDEELTDLIGEIEKGLEGLPRVKGVPARQERLTELIGRMQRARQVLHSFKVEMREIPRDQAVAYDQRARDHHTKLQSLHGDLQLAKTEIERAQIGARTIEEMTSGEIITEASKTQDQSIAALSRMNIQIESSKQVAADTSLTLKSQTEQLKNIDTDIMKVKSNLNRADVLIRAFVRKMATDKIIMTFMCLIFTGVVVIIIWKVVDPDGADESGVNVPDELVNPTDE